MPRCMEGDYAIAGAIVSGITVGGMRHYPNARNANAANLWKCDCVSRWHHCKGPGIRHCAQMHAERQCH